MLLELGQQLESQMQQVDSLMGQMGAVWNDRVAEQVSETLLATVVSECHSFSSETASCISLLQMYQEDMKRLLA